MEFPPTSAWIRYIAWARVPLAAAALLLSYLEPSAQPLFSLTVAVYLAYALAVAARIRGLSRMLGLLAIFGDTIFFVILASFGPDRLFWIAAAFYLYLLAEAVAFCGALDVAVIAAVCIGCCAVLPYRNIRALLPTVAVAGMLGCGFAWNRQRLKQQSSDLSLKLTSTQRAAEKAVEAERQRIASDFHDGPLQSFISLQMRLEILRKVLERDVAAGMEDLRELQTLALSQVRDLRAFLHSMRPMDVEGANLVATARRATESFQKETGIPVTFLGATTPMHLAPETTLEVLQMLRESLHNVQKHAGATRVAVAMEKTDRALEVSIDDNGHGFAFAGAYSLDELELLKLGPASLKRRARALGADLLLESRPGRGAGLKFRIPLQ